MQSGLVANSCDSIASERRIAASAASRAVMSNMMVRVAGPPAASTRTPVACTLIGRPSMVRASKSRTGTASPIGICSSLPMRSSARCRDSPGGCRSAMRMPFIASVSAKPNSRAADGLASKTTPWRCRKIGEGELSNSSR